MWGDHSGRVAHRPTRQPKTKLLPPNGGSGTARRLQAALKVLHLVIRNPIANRTDVTGRTTGWKAALNAVTLFYGDRIRGLVGDRRGEDGVVGWQVGVEGENAAAEADRFVAADIACDQDAAHKDGLPSGDPGSRRRLTSGAVGARWLGRSPSACHHHSMSRGVKGDQPEVGLAARRHLGVDSSTTRRKLGSALSPTSWCGAVARVGKSRRVDEKPCRC
jgi:hypothetical protein